MSGNRCLLAACVALVTLSIAHESLAAPVYGEIFHLRQPDGSKVPVRIWGDEFYQVVESLDGYTLVRDAKTLEICYARLSPDGNELRSTSILARQSAPSGIGVPRHIRINKEAARAKAYAARARFAAEDEKARELLGAPIEKAAPTSGNVMGICLLVDFPDEAGTILPSEVDNFCNQVGYTGYGNNGSVRDYFDDVSDGALTYTNYVTTAYYTALNNKAYYDNPAEPMGPKARELILEALNWLDGTGFDFSQYDSNGDGLIDGINCYYAGATSSGWAMGLWPHCGGISFSADGVSASTYQICSMGGNTLGLGVFCHENGHMICYWPDLYDYGFESNGVGVYCLMCYNGWLNPPEPSAYMKNIAGWATVTTLETPQSGLSVTAGINELYKYPHPILTNEYYLISNRQQTGRDSTLPDAGLAIWHIDTTGSNSNEQMTYLSHYRVTLVQADGNWNLENAINYGDSTDLYDAGSYDECGPLTYPNTDWWDGNSSGLHIHSIGSSASTMTFSFGDPDFHITPDTGLFSFGPEGGPLAPNSETFLLTNNGLTSLGWTASVTESWLDVTPTGGTLPPGGSTAVNVSLNANADALPADTYTDTVVFTNTTSGLAQARDVTLFVMSLLYVDADATGAGDGSSWTDAFTSIQDGIDAASLVQVWVAEGTYPESIILHSGAWLYGGFAGTETLLSERDITAHLTIIDASTADAGGPADHAVIMEYITGAGIDGFTVTGGFADGAYPDEKGGGVYCRELYPTVGFQPSITNCTITGNSASDGGGLYCWGSSPSITNCTITGNSASDGGALYCRWGSSPSITNCTINDNSAINRGGAVYCYSSSPLITNCTISGNEASNYGGAVYCYDNSDPAITNCTITGNSVAFCGGGLYCWGSSPSITNCTITGNSAAFSGGGLYCTTNSDPAITNTILEDNAGRAVYEVDADSDPTVTHCLFYNNLHGDYYDENSTTYTGASAINTNVAEASNNVDGDPLFANKAAGDYHLQYGSPAIDTGTASGAPSTDFEGEFRGFDGDGVGAGGTGDGSDYDIGADEYVDADEDGMPDWWENEHGLDPGNPDDAASDPDGDGLDNLGEYNSDTDPNDSDSDDDGLPDGWEVDNALDPNDSTGNNGAAADPDVDGLTNAEEYANSTDPNDPDSDDDGLNDGDEVNTHSTDPNDSDSDDDTLPDGWEVDNALDPNDSTGNNGSAADPDVDGLTNAEEYANGTDPNDADSDDDTLPDGWEVDSLLDPNDGTGDNGPSGDPDADGLTNAEEYSNGTDPNDPDSDDDGLNDADEVSAGTDPNDADSDDDGLSDGGEVAAGTNPNDAETWANFAYVGTETGTFNEPYDSLGEAIGAVAEGGTIAIRGDTGVNWTPETLRIVKPMRIQAVGGNVRIGVP